MNTAPKLLEYLASDLRHFRSECVEWHRPIVDRLITKVADIAAAIAPPSGEGVECMVRDLIERLAQLKKISPDNYSSLLTTLTCDTPQSAPEDGEQSFIDEWESRFGFLATHNNPRSIESIDEVACLLITPPPASQESSGDCLVCPECKNTSLFYECVACSHTNYPESVATGVDATTPNYAEAQHWIERYAAGVDGELQFDIVCAALGVPEPPSSAAEASINPHEIDSKLIPDAAEQAKPDDCPSCGQPQAGELPPRCAAARTLGNETLVEVALQAAGRASLIDSEIHRSRYCECRTELLRRLAGVVTVDDATIDDVAFALSHADSNAYSHDHYRDLARAALVAALGAK